MSPQSEIRIPVGLLAVAIFAIGLVLSIAFATSLGLPPDVLWSGGLIAFFLFVLCLQRPKLFLFFVFIYYGFFPAGTLLGQIAVPIPMLGRLDELVLMVPLAVLVMKGVRQELPKGATVFPLVYWLLWLLSTKVNDAPTMNAFRVGLSYFKFFVYWYFARVAGPWSVRERRAWATGFVLFALLQFPLNVFWNRAPYLRLVDSARGSLGSAHLVGYVESIALLLLLSWAMSSARKSPLRVMVFLFSGLVLSYDLIFMTDTKHILPILPIAAVFLIAAPRLRMRTRLAVIGLGLLFVCASYYYLTIAVERTGGYILAPREYVYGSLESGKGYVLRTILHYLPSRNPWFYLFGAGPGNFCSAVAVHAFRPLAEQHVLPFVIHALRSAGGAAESSVIGGPITSLFTLWGELGVPATIAYYLFWVYAIVHMTRSGWTSPELDAEAARRLAISGILLLLFFISSLVEVFTFGSMIMPTWTIAGMNWDPPPPDTRSSSGKATPPSASMASVPARRLLR